LEFGKFKAVAVPREVRTNKIKGFDIDFLIGYFEVVFSALIYLFRPLGKFLV
jgi:hypothetical protein